MQINFLKQCAVKTSELAKSVIPVTLEVRDELGLVTDKDELISILNNITQLNLAKLDTFFEKIRENINAKIGEDIE